MNCMGKILAGLHVFVMGIQSLEAITTIDPSHKEAYGANIGWLDAGDPASGAIIGQAFCAGYVYAANVGWIHLGDGTPSNGEAYLNNTATDYGVNHDGYGSLSGMAYGANIGWVVFEQAYGQPRVDLLTGNLSGSVWSANAGWIALATTTAYVRTETLSTGPDTDLDFIPDAWEYTVAGDLDVLSDGGADADGDGSTDLEEYEANTDPLDTTDNLRIIAIQSDESTDLVTWTCNPSRVYTLETALTLDIGTLWAPASSSFIPESGPAVSEEVTGVTEMRRFYRVEVHPPLGP